MKTIVDKYLRLIKYIERNKLQKISKIETNYISPLDRYYLDELNSSYDHFKVYFSSSVLFKDEYQHLLFAFNETEEKNRNFLNLEFGVWTGKTINLISKEFSKNKFYGFDTFEGLVEKWFGQFYSSFHLNRFSLNGQMPKVNSNVKLTKGNIFDTLDNFLNEQQNSNINFIHIDVDTYPTTKFILEKTKKFMLKNSVIVFDELHGRANWSNGEYKALIEVYEENEYEFISFSHEQAAVKIL